MDNRTLNIRGKLYKVLCFVLLGVISEAGCHVSLRFPPARELQLDFLNNFWTKAPCGMPKGRSSTILSEGSTFNVNWQLGYAHDGGYHLELLDGSGQPIYDLSTPFSTDYANSTTQWHKVKLPNNFTCDDCTIRLLRQVPAFDPNFVFLSCGDVKIVPSSSYKERCSYRGYLSSNGKCRCNAGYWGKICQYKDECGTHSQCGKHGLCIYMGGTNLPRRQCFCEAGYFGYRCSKRSNLPEPSHSLNLTSHTLQILSNRLILYYKVIESSKEVEFVVLMNGTSYVGIGWRPSNISPSCKSWPFASGREEHGARGYSEWSAQDAFTKMDCSDIIIGTAKEGYHRIKDYYARGRHTPLLDEEWGGQDDLTAATGWEKDGVTTIIFRRKILPLEQTSAGDHSLTGEVLLIWSMGQSEDSPESRFYVQDELKYHGTGELQRGSLYIDFTKRESRHPGLNGFILQ